MLIEKLQNIKTVLVGSSGIGAIEFLQNMPSDDLTKLIIQVIIGIITIVKIILERKGENKKDEKVPRK